MKIKLNLSPEYREKEVVINAAQKDDEVQQILDSLKDVEEKFNHLNGYLGETVYSLALKDILFLKRMIVTSMLTRPPMPFSYIIGCTNWKKIYPIIFYEFLNLQF